MTAVTWMNQSVERDASAIRPPNALQDDLRAVLHGTLGGMLGTAAMSAVMLAARKAGLIGRLPPERIIQKAFFPGLRRRKHEAAKNRLAVLFHFGFGAVGGATFGVLHRRLPLPIPPALYGAALGTAIWIVSYMGWAPALGLMPPAHRDRRDRPIIMLLVHWIYGATLGTVVSWLDHRSQG